MKLLSDILYKAGITNVHGTTNVAITNVCFDSRKIAKDSLFVAIKGVEVDGHDYILKSVEKGAIAVVCETLPDEIDSKITYVEVVNSSVALGFIASNFYDNPSSELTLVGVTGTNGKTTTATLLYDLFRKMAKRVGLLSTVLNKIDNEELVSTHTTPDALSINKLLRQMVDAKCMYCFMEVSSHAVIQNRISGLSFAGGVFTNITHDHLDYHKTFDEYIKAKKYFFDHLTSDAFALINKDDKQGLVMLQNTKAKKSTFSLHSVSDYKCKIIENQFSGLLLNIDGNEVWTKLLGEFNAYNLMVCYATALLLGMDKLNVLTTLSSLDAVEGRFDCMKSIQGVTCIVDYAHTPDALENILDTINNMREGNESLITVMGCGGDRDVEKRPIMARIASQKSDKIIITSDNPRSEKPDSIISDMRKGIESKNDAKVLAITDRKEAIKTACALAEKGDIILVAGKGHEKYQEINGEKFPFDDKEILAEACKMTNTN